MGLSVSPTTPKFGDTITYTCAKLPRNDVRYEFLLTLPDGTQKALTATGNVSQTVKVDQYGTYKAVCGVCATSQPGKCLIEDPFQFN
jgi:hypothetical protein